MQLQNGRPTDTTGRLDKEIRTYDFLDKLGIEYQRIDHEAAFTMEVCEEIDKTLGATICKNLFLCNRQKTDFYLLMIPGDKTFKTKELSHQIGSARLSFASPQDMEKYLDITPGSVSVMGLMNDHDNAVRLLVDEDVLKGEWVGCHPCINTSSLRIKTKDMFGPVIKAMHHDMDGTLIDTEKYYRIFWPMALKQFGYDMTDEQALSMRSLGQPYAPQHLKDMFHDPDMDYNKIRAYRRKIMEEHLEKVGIELKPGAIEILTYLKEKGIHRAISTANDIERAEKYLKKIGLYGYFDKIICAPMVEHGKPAPDVYEFACSELKLAPEECMAVEDSPNGVKSAYSAGCKVVMVPDLTQPDEELKKMLFACVDRIDEIKSIV